MYCLLLQPVVSLYLACPDRHLNASLRQLE